MDKVEFGKLWEASGIQETSDANADNPDAIIDTGMSDKLAAHFEKIADMEDDDEVMAYIKKWEYDLTQNRTEAMEREIPQWKPIDTAPKDGTVFDTFVPHDAGGFQFTGVINLKGKLMCMMSGDDFTETATHWKRQAQPPTDAI